MKFTMGLHHLDFATAKFVAEESVVLSTEASLKVPREMWEQKLGKATAVTVVVEEVD